MSRNPKSDRKAVRVTTEDGVDLIDPARLRRPPKVHGSASDAIYAALFDRYLNDCERVLLGEDIR